MKMELGLGFLDCRPKCLLSNTQMCEMHSHIGLQNGVPKTRCIRPLISNRTVVIIFSYFDVRPRQRIKRERKERERGRQRRTEEKGRTKGEEDQNTKDGSGEARLKHQSSSPSGLSLFW